MPVHKVKGGYKWGNHGHVYPSKAGAQRQAAAIFANGYREEAEQPQESAGKSAAKTDETPKGEK